MDILSDGNTTKKKYRHNKSSYRLDIDQVCPAFDGLSAMESVSTIISDFFADPLLIASYLPKHVDEKNSPSPPGERFGSIGRPRLSPARRCGLHGPQGGSCLWLGWRILLMARFIHLPYNKTGNKAESNEASDSAQLCKKPRPKCINTMWRKHILGLLLKKHQLVMLFFSTFDIAVLAISSLYMHS